MKLCKPTKPLFWKAHIISLALFIVTLGFSLKQFIFIKKADYDNYRLLLQKNLAQDVRNISLQAEQKRENIKKDIWINKKNTLHHLHLESAASTVSFIPHLGKINMVENFSDIKLILTEDDKNVKYFIAKEGVYMFPSYQFFAFNVLMKMLPSQDSLTEPHAFLSGTAKELFFHFLDGKYFLQADDFSAQLQQDGL